MNFMPQVDLDTRRISVYVLITRMSVSGPATPT